MEKLLIAEECYREQMKQTVIPYLQERREVRYLEREKGKKIYCEKYSADHPKGVVMISHGYTENAVKCRENCYYFLKRGYHVYMPEHCGHGRSYRLNGDIAMVHTDEYERYVKDFILVSQTAKQENQKLPLFLYGHSMGGGIAAAVLAEEPDLFQKAVLSSPMIRPKTGKVPWYPARFVAAVCCRFGKKEQYVIGHGKDSGRERFEDSASLSRARFEEYQDRKQENPLFQQKGASYGWLYAAAQLNHFIRKTAWKKIKTPLLIFQAEEENYVSQKEQNRFTKKLEKAHPGIVTMVKIPGTKHEISNADGERAAIFWEKIFEFLKEESE